MWFMDQQGRYINSDLLQMIQIAIWDEEREVVAYEAGNNNISYVLYTGSEKDCRAWVENLVRTINKYKVGVL